MTNQYEQGNRSGQSVYWTTTNDAEIDAAGQRSRDTFRYFVREVSWERRRAQPALDLAAVKIAFGEQASPDAETIVEHLWIGEADFDGVTVRGRLLNDPKHAQSVRRGVGVQVPFDQITDWMYAIDGRAYGGFSVNLLRSRMSDENRAAHDASWGLEFSEPYDVAVVPDRTRIEKRGILGRKKQVTVVADLAAEHPMALTVAQSLHQRLAKDPGLAHRRDARGWTHVHELALAGSTACVEAFLDRGANPSARTNHDMTPAQLAASVGWPEVVALLRERGGA